MSTTKCSLTTSLLSPPEETRKESDFRTLVDVRRVCSGITTHTKTIELQGLEGSSGGH